MRQEVKDFFTGLSVLLLYLFSSFILILVLYILHINFNNFNNTQKIIFNITFELILISIIIFIYRKKIINDIKKIKQCKFIHYLRYWFIALGTMMICNILINTFFHINTSSNQEEIIKTFDKAPIYTLILATIFAPILEELIFRLSIRKMFKNNTIFIIVSGLLFGLMHVIEANSIQELLFIIPYSIPGCIFAYTLIKSDNILVPIGLHFIHNSFMMIIQIILIFI